MNKKNVQGNQKGGAHKIAQAGEICGEGKRKENFVRGRGGGGRGGGKNGPYGRQKKIFGRFVKRLLTNLRPRGYNGRKGGGLR